MNSVGVKYFTPTEFIYSKKTIFYKYFTPMELIQTASKQKMAEKQHFKKTNWPKTIHKQTAILKDNLHKIHKQCICKPRKKRNCRTMKMN